MQGPAFMLMENVQSFIQAAKNYGVPDEEMFLTPDLFEGKNLSQVNIWGKNSHYKYLHIRF